MKRQTCCSGSRVRCHGVLAAVVLFLVAGLPVLVAAGQKEDVWGDKPAPKGGAARKKGNPGKVGKLNPRVQQQLDAFLKKNRKVAQYRKKIADAQAEIRLLEGAQTRRERRRAEREIPKLEKKIEHYKARLERELGKLRTPIERELTKLKDKEAAYQNKAMALEEKGRNADRYRQKIDALQPDIRRLSDQISTLDAAGDVEEPEEEGVLPAQ